ncbi:PhzF family phenazine biosynthesis protein [Novosphingobium pentaromativorans]|uniref:Phenazine biosynthesis family protein n=1 Tax=Novosphingobium pentaromativorans US6-1 TaxID=1088721 RepID=G6EGN4_9SPHN|nr:PhzF family phenazine biosynthesis protein [Novosphingobium pentaromativorans]AIT82141.1 PhzF family phenazine biosynthesis protein [Novosphingobium pentaromativorans US6-1]EHJ59581.1 phenazine biosynthesis family protein [Novosphingobium pentaromativorans US6-1]
MTMQHIAAFSIGSTGGNPAGVVIGDTLPEPDRMQALAAQVDYSESVFAAPTGDTWKVRYFAPDMEIDFCGHATIALGAALARRYGPGRFMLDLNRARIEVEGHCSDAKWGAAFRSPGTRSDPVTHDALQEALSLFRLSREDLDERLPPAVANAGGDHLVLCLRDREALRAMAYDLEAGRSLAQRMGYVTFTLVHAENARLFHVRNPFPAGGVYEDPATGAAAAAFAGYLRDRNWPHGGRITIQQGDDMGIPCRIDAEIPPAQGEGIRVAGAVRELTPPEPED